MEFVPMRLGVIATGIRFYSFVIAKAQLRFRVCGIRMPPCTKHGMLPNAAAFSDAINPQALAGKVS